MSNIQFTERQAVHQQDFKSYDTERIREEFLVSDMFHENEFNFVYSMYDRLVIGGIVPTKRTQLEPFDSLKAENFLDRREMGIINIGKSGKVTADGQTFDLAFKDALYIGAGSKDIYFESDNPSEPARFYITSAPAHHTYPTKKVTLKDAEVVHLGNQEASNERKLNKMIATGVIETCQLQMGITVMSEGCVWNTMPPHTHGRRMEAYMYFEVPEEHGICHFMGHPQRTRHIWMKNEEAVLSPSWSIHSAAGTYSYSFVWTMAGENLAFTDMDAWKIQDLR